MQLSFTHIKPNIEQASFCYKFLSKVQFSISINTDGYSTKKEEFTIDKRKERNPAFQSNP